MRLQKYNRQSLSRVKIYESTQSLGPCARSLWFGWEIKDFFRSPMETSASARREVRLYSTGNLSHRNALSSLIIHPSSQLLHSIFMPIQRGPRLISCMELLSSKPQPSVNSKACYQSPEYHEIVTICASSHLTGLAVEGLDIRRATSSSHTVKLFKAPYRKYCKQY